MKKSTFIFLLLAVAAGVSLWYFEFKREKPPEPLAGDSTPAFTFKDDDVTAFTITRAGDNPETLAFERRGKNWWMTQPVDSAVDSSAVDSVVFRSSSARIDKTLTPAAEQLAQFGLKEPKVTLQLKLKNGAHNVRFGEKDFTGSNVYAILDDRKDVAVVSAELLDTVTKPALDYRDRKIASVNEDDIVRIRVKNRHQSMLAEKNSAGSWIVREPAAQQGRELIASRVLLTLENGLAVDIIDQPTAAQRARLAHPEVEIELTGKDGRSSKYMLAPEENPAAKKPAKKTGKKEEPPVESGSERALFGSSAGARLFKIPKSGLETLNFKIADIVQEPPKEEPPKPEPAAKAPAKKTP
jgi:hypothetical protein